MSLTPKNINFAEIGGTGLTPESQPSKTYYLDLANGILSSKTIDGENAIRQFIQKAIQTARFRFLIYSEEYGCELEELVGQDVSPALLETEIPRVITEALVFDDRIETVSEFNIWREDSNLNISFKVVTVSGIELIEEVTI